MKRFFTLFVILLLLLIAFLGCTAQSEVFESTTEIQNENLQEADYIDNTDELIEEGSGELMLSRVDDILFFSSLDDLLSSYQAANSMLRQHSTTSLSEELMALTTLEILYIPVGVPQEYQLFEIAVRDEVVTYLFLRGEHMVSEEAIMLARIYQEGFSFTFRRWDLDNPMEGILRQNRVTEADLIHGRYLLASPNRLIWQNGRSVAFVRFPSDYVGGDIDQIIAFAETTAINLTNQSITS